MDITSHIIECIENSIPVSFLKYGDGEFNCMCRHYGCNCDGDNYTHKLSNSLIASFKFIVENTNNSYIGAWHTDNVKCYYESLTSKPIKWSKYHTIIFDKSNDIMKAKLYSTIKHSTRKKIILCNKHLIKSEKLLNLDHMIFVPLNNWFDNNFENIFNQISNLIGEDNNHILITCAGMGSKVLIAELIKKFPNGIYLDFGSALDTICTKHDTRGFKYGYEYFVTMLKDCLPDDWEDDRYNVIYESAQKNLGRHLS
jgi:hypothetical protein